MESSLCIYKGKIQEAFNLVQFGMNTEYRLKAVQYWNAVSEHLQNLVNPSSNVFTASNPDTNRIDPINTRNEQHSIMTSNQSQISSTQSDLQVYNIVSSNNTMSSGSNDLFFNEYLTNGTTDCVGELASPSNNEQISKEENSNHGDSILTNKVDENSLLHIVEQTLEDQTMEDSGNDNKTTLKTFPSSLIAVSQANQVATEASQTMIVSTDSNTLTNTLTPTSSSLNDAYMVDDSTILQSTITMAQNSILIGTSTSSPVSSPSNDVQRIETTSNAVSSMTDDMSSLPTHSLIDIDPRAYVSSGNNHMLSGIPESSTLHAQSIRAHPPLIPPLINNPIHSQTIVLSHASPVETYNIQHSALHHQLQPLNGYDHHIALQHSRPLQQHQMINYEMVGLNPEYNYIQTLSCDICGKQLENPDDLSVHRASHSSEDIIRDNNHDTSCQTRAASESDAPDTSASINAHLTPNGLNQHCCDICGKSGFSTKGNLKRHLRAHSGEKPFKCDYCDSRFTEKKSLKIHLRRHTGEKPYKCDVCGKLFSQTGVLQSHTALHLNERKFGCNLCGKAFRQRSQLKLHIMRHEGVKRLECSTCSAKFLTKGDLERHYRIHTGERPYECKICKKTFTRQQSLNEHLNRHYGTKPYSCPSCDKTFSEMSACYKHAKIHKKQESNQ